jgi:hypothetical protein
MPEPVLSLALANSVMEQRSNTLEAREPAKAMFALEMLSAGSTWSEIATETGFNFNQISKLRARNEVAIDVRKKQLAADGFEMAEGLRLLIKQKMDMLANDPGALRRVNLRDLVLPYGIAVDKGMMAMGEHKVVIEHRSNKPSLEDAMKAIEDARRQLQKEAIPVEALTVEVPAE